MGWTANKPLANELPRKLSSPKRKTLSTLSSSKTDNPTAMATTSALLLSATTRHRPSPTLPRIPKLPPAKFPSQTHNPRNPTTHLRRVTSKPPTTTPPSPAASARETIYFDGGAHYGDLVANLLLGFTLLWLPLTLAAVFRAFFLRYRFTDVRVTVISGLTGQDRSDFSYDVITDVQVVPRFVGEWGDVIITLKDGTKVDLRSVPKFREIAKYCLELAKEKGTKGI